jgi:hypothetical protein
LRRLEKEAIPSHSTHDIATLTRTEHYVRRRRITIIIDAVSRYLDCAWIDLRIGIVAIAIVRDKSGGGTACLDGTHGCAKAIAIRILVEGLRKCVPMAKVGGDCRLTYCDELDIRRVARWVVAHLDGIG